MLNVKLSLIMFKLKLTCKMFNSRSGFWCQRRRRRGQLERFHFGLRSWTGILQAADVAESNRSRTFWSELIFNWIKNKVIRNENNLNRQKQMWDINAFNFGVIFYFSLNKLWQIYLNIVFFKCLFFRITWIL